MIFSTFFFHSEHRSLPSFCARESVEDVADISVDTSFARFVPSDVVYSLVASSSSASKPLNIRDTTLSQSSEIAGEETTAIKRTTKSLSQVPLARILHRIFLIVRLQPHIPKLRLTLKWIRPGPRLLPFPENYWGLA